MHLLMLLLLFVVVVVVVVVYVRRDVIKQYLNVPPLRTDAVWHMPAEAKVC